MDRNNSLVKKIIMGILIILPLCFWSCFSEKTPTEKEFLGVWKSQYDEILVLENDSLFRIDNLKAKTLFGETSPEKISGIGKWEIIKKYGGWRLHMEFSDYAINGVSEKKGFHTDFYILGSNFLGNKPPWVIRSWDEDDLDYSVFKKQLIRF